MILENLYHYSSEKDLKLCENYRKFQEIIHFKPTGFWVSVEAFDDDQTWFTWCQSEGFGLERLKYKYHVKLKKSAKILHIGFSDQLTEFGKENIYDPIYINKLKGIYYIDWSSTYKNYDGIVIAPYQWNCRYGDHIWYYTWDCASGCIWNIDAIEKIELIDEF